MGLLLTLTLIRLVIMKHFVPPLAMPSSWLMALFPSYLGNKRELDFLPQKWSIVV